MSGANLRELLPCRVARTSPAVRLVCFPFSGGSAAMYRPWSDLLPDRVDVCAVELPGHGSRLGQAPLASMEAVVSLVLRGLAALPPLPTVFFGHSLGGRVAFACGMRATDPRMVIAAGTSAPHLGQGRHDGVRGEMTRAQLVAELRRMGGTPPEVLADDELMDIFLPTIRADFTLFETYQPGAAETIACPIVVLAAKDDRETPLEDARQWSVHTTSTFTFLELDGGGHFFLQSRRDEVLRHVTTLLEVVG